MSSVSVKTHQSFGETVWARGLRLISLTLCCDKQNSVKNQQVNQYQPTSGVLGLVRLSIAIQRRKNAEKEPSD